MRRQMVTDNGAFGELMHEILRPMSDHTFMESYRESFRPANGALRTITERKEVTVQCKYPDPDDGVSYSWVKVDRPEDKNGES